MNKLIKTDKVLSISEYKEKIQTKEKRIKEFEEGPQPLPTCTCGQHTDPNQFLIEKQVTKHYLKDRKRYVEGLKYEDLLVNYMKIFKNLMSDTPLVKLNMNTQLSSTKYVRNHFNKAMEFYNEYIKGEKDLTFEEKKKAEELKIGYDIYKEHIAKSLINSYIIDKLDFIRKNSQFAWTEAELLKREDTLDTSLNESEAYIEFMKEHFHNEDLNLRAFILTDASENLDRQINERLNGKPISTSEIETLGIQIKKSLDLIEKMMVDNRQRDLRLVLENYKQVEDDCSLEHKTKMLIDIELRKREIDGFDSNNTSEFTTNNSINQLLQTIGMENLICKLPTKELESLFQQLKLLT